MTSKSATFAKESLPSQYAHTFHAGNVGDVWKHVVLMAIMHELMHRHSAIDFMDCYAGSGGYRLPPVGEWNEGVGKVLNLSNAECGAALTRYLDLIKARFGANRFYLGSPLIIESLLRSGDSLRCCETSERAFSELTAQISEKSQCYHTDGLAALLEVVRGGQSSSRHFFALLDPPWVKKEDWQTIPGAVVRAFRMLPSATLALWYPIKSYTRVNAMIKMFQEANLPAAVLDLITTPLEQQKNRLNGSGMILVNPDVSVLAEVSAAASLLGRACATSNGYWSLRVTQLARSEAC